MNESRVIWISHGVGTERYRPREDIHPAVSEDRLTLLFVGRLISRKGADLAVETLAATDSDDVELLVAGSGRLGHDLKQLAREHSVANRVTFLGYVPDEELPLLYSSADMILFTSNYEGFGLVFLQSLASGTPVAGTSIGGISDIIENGSSGYVCGDDPVVMSERIEQLTNYPESLAAMLRAARDEVDGRDLKHVATRVEIVYENVTR